MRISNFLLWQISYAEFWDADLLGRTSIRRCSIRRYRDYAQRVRRFGGLKLYLDARLKPRRGLHMLSPCLPPVDGSLWLGPTYPPEGRWLSPWFHFSSPCRLLVCWVRANFCRCLIPRAGRRCCVDRSSPSSRELAAAIRIGHRSAEHRHVASHRLVAVGIAVSGRDVRFPAPTGSSNASVRRCWSSSISAYCRRFFPATGWPDSGSAGNYPSRSTLAIALTVFVPKRGDIGPISRGSS
jgi:hypothetical protein